MEDLEALSQDLMFMVHLSKEVSVLGMYLNFLPVVV